jgi:hypothetical protein
VNQKKTFFFFFLCLSESDATARCSFSPNLAASNLAKQECRLKKAGNEMKKKNNMIFFPRLTIILVRINAQRLLFRQHCNQQK